MKTLHPVDEETYKRLGKAYLICLQYPDVFGDVTMKKFCSMFVDVLDEDEDEREARMKSHASEMYRVLKIVRRWSKSFHIGDEVEYAVNEVLRKIDGGKASDE